ncbi:MAG: ATP-binding protein [Pseudomonadota bacterium]
MDITLVDVTIHIDETLDPARQADLTNKVRDQEGVVSVGYHDVKPHLMIVEYNPEKTSSQHLLATVKSAGLNAELIGL